VSRRCCGWTGPGFQINRGTLCRLARVDCSSCLYNGQCKQAQHSIMAMVQLGDLRAGRL
jgi:hypothetical protein